MPLQYKYSDHLQTLGSRYPTFHTTELRPCPVELDNTSSLTKPRRAFLSVVIPARNEAATLVQLIAETICALRRLCLAGRPHLEGFEIIIVDDGSTDATQLILHDLVRIYPELKSLILVASTGQSAATVAGIRAASGDWIATLDADLQNNPADLVRLWRVVEGSNCVALGWRAKRKDVWSKRLVSRWANKLRNGLLGQSIRDTGCSVRIFPRAIALRLPTFRGMHRFFGTLLLREGCNLVQIPVRHRARSHGQSHYHIWNRSVQVAIDLLGIVWLINRPLQYRVRHTLVFNGQDQIEAELMPRTNAGLGHSGSRWGN